MKEKEKEEVSSNTSSLESSYPMELSEGDRLKNTYCRHMKIEYYCRCCAAVELGERLRREWPSMPWKGLTAAMTRESNMGTYFKSPGEQDVMF